jgi:hypothetical protein
MDRQDGAGHGVESGGEHDRINVDRSLACPDPRRRDQLDGLLPQIDQADVGPVEGRVVAGLQTWPLGAERMVARRERLRGRGILHHRTDVPAQEVGRERIALEVAALVGPQLRQHDDEVARR